MGYLYFLHPIVLFRIVGYLHATNKQRICAFVFAYTILWTNAMTKKYGLFKTIIWYVPITFVHIILNLNRPYFIFKVPCHDLVPFFLLAFGLSMSLIAVIFYFLQGRCNTYLSHFISAALGILFDDVLASQLLLKKFAPAKVWMMTVRGTKLKLMALAVSIVSIIVLNHLYKLFKKYVAPKLGLVYARSFAKKTAASKSTQQKTNPIHKCHHQRL